MMNYFTFKKKRHENDDGKKTNKKLMRFLITVNVRGSAGPLRFLVNNDDLVSQVIQMTLRSYARQGRRPVLGFDAANFSLYSPGKFEGSALAVLIPTETIGSCGGREFTLIKKNTDNGLKDGKRQKNFKWKSCFVSQPNTVLAS